MFADKSKAAQTRVYADPAFRNAVPRGAEEPDGLHGNWGRITVHEVQQSRAEAARGQDRSPRSPQEQGKDGVDAFLDLALADDLDIELTMASFNTREDRMTRAS